MHKMNKKYVGGVALVLVVCIGVTFVFLRKPTVATGIRYIEKMEAMPTAKISQSLHEKRVEEMLEAIEHGQLDIFSMFDDYKFLGDSRVMGFSVYGYLSDSDVLANSGNTILNITDWLDVLEQTQPSSIYFSYGVNDMGLNLGQSDGGYGKAYEAQIQEVKKVCPNANIFVLAIIPPSAQALQKNPKWSVYESYNEQMFDMCKENGWTYINCASLVHDQENNIYQQDGIHFLNDFYKTWANLIIEKSLEVLA